MDEELKLGKWVPSIPGEEPPIMHDILPKEFLVEFTKTYNDNLLSLFDQFADAYYVKITGEEDDD